MRLDEDHDRSSESGRIFAPLLLAIAGVLSALVAAGCGSASEQAGGGGGGTGSLDGGSPDAPAPPPFQADQPYTYVAKVKNLLVGLPRHRRRDPAGRRRPGGAEDADRRLDAAAAVRGQDEALLRAGLPADAGHRVRLLRSGLPEADRHQRHDDAAAGAERAAELRAHDDAAHRRRPPADRGADQHAGDDDHRDEGVLRVPRRLGGRRQRQGHRPLQAAARGPVDRRRDRGRADPDRRHARPAEPELHALVQPRRRDQQRHRRRLHRGSDHLPGERRHPALPALRLARRAQEQHRRAVPADRRRPPPPRS